MCYNFPQEKLVYIDGKVNEQGFYVSIIKGNMIMLLNTAYEWSWKIMNQLIFNR